MHDQGIGTQQEATRVSFRVLSDSSEVINPILCAIEQLSSSCNSPSMKQYNLAHRNGIEGLELKTDAPIPLLRSPKDVCVSYRLAGEADNKIRINIKCLSLNARDLQIATNDYPAPHDVPEGVIPVSGRSIECTRLIADGSGVVEAVGEEVTLFKVGDRVAPVFPQGHDYVSKESLHPSGLAANDRRRIWLCEVSSEALEGESTEWLRNISCVMRKRQYTYRHISASPKDRRLLLPILQLGQVCSRTRLNCSQVRPFFASVQVEYRFALLR